METLRDLKAGKSNRRTAAEFAVPQGVNLDAGQVRNARDRSWDLYNNNPHANKATRSIVAQAIGTGMVPQSQATRSNGKPWEQFRVAAEELWAAVSDQLCFEGRPGFGGHDIGSMAQLALNSTVLGGEVFTIKVNAESAKEMADEGRLLPFSLRLCTSDQVPDESSNCMAGYRPLGENFVWSGIEFTPEWKRAAYWIYRSHPNDNAVYRNYNDLTRVESHRCIHTFMSYLPGMQRGTTWLAPSSNYLADWDEAEENELFSTKVAACPSMMVIRNSAPAAGLGLQPPPGATNTTPDGDKVTRMQPGMIFYGKTGDELKGFNPNRPSSTIDQFGAMILRSAAAGIRCTKPSTMTMNYKESTFAAEKASENDVWREVEQVQEWFAKSWYHPIWRWVIEAGIEIGWFDSISSGGNTEAFRAMLRNRINDLCACEWQGPVQKALNPAADENASKIAIATGKSNLKIECATIGLNWRRVMEQRFEELKLAKEMADTLQMPIEYLLQTIPAQKQTVPADAGGKPPLRTGKNGVNRAAHFFPETNGVAH